MPNQTAPVMSMPASETNQALNSLNLSNFTNIETPLTIKQSLTPYTLYLIPYTLYHHSSTYLILQFFLSHFEKTIHPPDHIILSLLLF
jgi:hypothetical protein